jgi:sugar phosphate isomerase/epimerase
MHKTITTDFVSDTLCPEPFLEAVARAGFTHVHWCHEWCSDHLYTPAEVAQIARWLESFGLRLLDLHASHGRETDWLAADRSVRQAGLDLVRNRIRMTRDLGAGVIVLHLSEHRPPTPSRAAEWDGVRSCIDALTPELTAARVAIAFENLVPDNLPLLRRVFEEYPADVAGLCYDAGHGNLLPDTLGLDGLETCRDRLLAVHLHDNDGTGDQHRLPFTGTVDWNRLTALLAGSSYQHGASLEVSMRAEPITDMDVYLAHAHTAAEQLNAMVAAAGIDSVV